MKIKVKCILPDRFDRPRVKNLENGGIYVDISYDKNEWHTTSQEGEPEWPLEEGVIFVFENGHEAKVS